MQLIHRKAAACVGSYRIIFTVDHDRLIVCVVDAGNEGQRYNKY